MVCVYSRAIYICAYSRTIYIHGFRVADIIYRLGDVVQQKKKAQPVVRPLRLDR